MDKIKKALIEANENSLVSLSNKGTYKRACKDIDGMMLISHEEQDSVIVEISGETVTVKTPFEECSCTCVSRTVCRHIIGAILLLKNNLTEEDFADYALDDEPEPEKIPETDEKSPETINTEEISPTEIRRINECAVNCLDMIGDVLKRGLVRIPETMHDNMEISAVRCHALRMADAERAVRDLGTRIGEFLARRASFSTADFLRNMCYTVSMLESLCRSDITPDMLGNFRQEYQKYQGYLTLMPVGQRSVSGGNYESEIYYFLNPEATENSFMSVSDMRPTFYDTTKKRHISRITPWGMAITLDNMMKNKLVLANAKVCNGKISTSQKTIVAMNTVCDLNCNEVRDRIYCDFRQVIVELYEKNPQNELQRMMFIHPKKCVSSGFDKHTQQYTLVIEDETGFPAYMTVQYRAETSKLVELVESIGEKMMKNPTMDYTILAIVSIEKSRLVLFPVEIYDFITPPEYDDYWLPSEYETDDRNVEYYNVIAELLNEIQGDIELMMQCGMQSGISLKLENKCFNYGLMGLNKLLCIFRQSTEAYRHNTQADIKEILHQLTIIMRYISTARKRLEIILTLNRSDEI